MTKHTPGPWKWWTSNSWRRLSQDAPMAKDGGVLCPYVSRADGHPDLIVSDADARLIEAAPELYDVLKELSDALPFAEEMRAEGEEEGPYLVRMRAILAKVEGRSNG